MLLIKSVYPDEYMDILERYNEIFYIEFYLKYITDKYYKHAQKVLKELELKNLGDYHNLSARSDTLLLADAFENSRNKFIETYELVPAHFLSAPGLPW